MASSNRLTASYLKQAVKDPVELHKESFTALVRYLEANAPLSARVGYAISLKYDFARFGQQPLLHFCSAAFYQVNFANAIREYKIKNSYFGLLGINGPLPIHLTEHAIEREFRFKDATFSEFLDLFNHRFISLFYRAWADAQPAVNYDRPNQDHFKPRYYAIAGDGGQLVQNKASVNEYETQSVLSNLVGLFSHKNSSGKVLCQILSQYIGTKVTLSEFQGQWYQSPANEQLSLGRKNAVLGHSALIGQRFFQRIFNFAILVGPVNYQRYIELVSNSEIHKKILELIHKFIGREYDFSISIYLQPKQTCPSRLGLSKLGLNSWCQGETAHLAQTEPHLACVLKL